MKTVIVFIRDGNADDLLSAAIIKRYYNSRYDDVAISVVQCTSRDCIPDIENIDNVVVCGLDITVNQYIKLIKNSKSVMCIDSIVTTTYESAALIYFGNRFIGMDSIGITSIEEAEERLASVIKTEIVSEKVQEVIDILHNIFGDKRAEFYIDTVTRVVMSRPNMEAQYYVGRILNMLNKKNHEK